MEWGNEYVGSILFVVGVLLVLARRKRKFDRTNEFGVERFATFGAKMGAKIKDGLLGGSSILFLSSGLLILAFRYVDSWGWIVVLPVCVLMLFLLLGA